MLRGRVDGRGRDSSPGRALLPQLPQPPATVIGTRTMAANQDIQRSAVTDLELLRGFGAEDVVAWFRNQAITRRRFLGEVASLATRMPDGSAVINLCRDRYRFLVGFAAALVRGQTNVLPPSEAANVLKEIAARYTGCYCLIDSDESAPGLETLPYPESLSPCSPSETVPRVPPEHVAAVVFTSGSTGESRPHSKSWGSLVTGAAMARRRFFSVARPRMVVGTVPPQHMYGLETTILLPLQSGVAIHHARPLFPEALRGALIEASSPRMLVTTPVHIRACVLESTELPEIQLMLSATAPLPRSLAQKAEDLFGTRVLEIYGCTEAGSIASRRTVAGDLWQAYDGMSLFQNCETSFVRGASLAEPVELGDVIRMRDTRVFSLHGRTADMVNIAGRRGSLNSLNHWLNEIEGVRDGVFFMPDETPGKVTRLAAVVVAPGLLREEILAELRKSIDSAFMPRPLHLVDRLPRTASGKIPRSALLDLINRVSSSRTGSDSA